ncbi:sigma-70 family RNA polymerase sigma factor [Emcibacter sp. SYSU 3D8]|uniref:sigma-70 family RNA polymerase sigma factor n=1 Tax=Emcibacter sp. SYSU 3D8 TaxID=3133969 RepID=UPI0031FEDCAA
MKRRAEAADEVETVGHGAAEVSVHSDGAFARLLEDVVPHLRGYARSLCRSPSQADDLVQDALLRAWAARDRFQAGTNFKAWIFVILRNRFLSGLRRRKFEQESTGNEPDMVAPAAQPGHMDLLAVRDALDKLSPSRREALMLVGAAGMSYEEAASICDCAIGTIKSRVSRARSELQQLLDGEGPEAGQAD